MMQTHKTRLDRLETRTEAITAHRPGLLVHHTGGSYSLELGGQEWPSLDAVHAANPGHDPNSNTILTWV